MAHLAVDASLPLAERASQDNLAAPRGILLGLSLSAGLWLGIAYAVRAVFF